MRGKSSMLGKTPKWMEFEKKAFEIQKSLSSANSEVTHNDLIHGQESKTDRQIDISIRSKVGTYSILVAVECKDYKNPVDVTEVEAFISKIRDVRAHKGVMISARGFTEAARNRADHNDIDLRRLIDTESVDWGANIAVPCLLQRTYMASCTIEVHDFIELPYQTDRLMALELKNESGEIVGTFQDVLHRKWDSKEVPHSVGRHRITIGTKLTTEFNGATQVGAIYSDVAVEQAFYSGMVPIHFQGLINVKSGGIITRQILTGAISPIAISKGECAGWKQIDDPSALSPAPAFTIGYFDVYFRPNNQPEGKNPTWPEQDTNQ
jgi:hypothetical protein